MAAAVTCRGHPSNTFLNRDLSWGGVREQRGWGGRRQCGGTLGGTILTFRLFSILGGSRGRSSLYSMGSGVGVRGGAVSLGRAVGLGVGGTRCPHRVPVHPPPPPNAPSHLNWQTAPSPGWKVGVSAPPRGRWRSAPGLGGAAAPGTASSGAVGGGPRGGLRQSRSGTWAVTGRGRWGNVGSAVGWGDEGGKRGPMDGGVLTLGGSGGGTSAGSVLLGERSCEQSGGRGGSRP